MRRLAAGDGGSQAGSVLLFGGGVKRGFQYGETCAVMIIIIISVSAIDLISARIRKVLV